MRRLALVLVTSSALALSGCGKSLTTGDGKVHGTYGLLNQASKDPDLCYEVSAGNAIWSIILIESVIFPLYFIGFSIMDPVRSKRSAIDDCGAL